MEKHRIMPVEKLIGKSNIRSVDNALAEEEAMNRHSSYVLAPRPDFLDIPGLIEKERQRYFARGLAAVMR